MFNKNIFLFFGNGELGNQLFQYCFIRSNVPKNSILITTHFVELNKLINLDNNVKIVTIKNKILKFFLNKLINKFLFVLSKIRLLTSINTDLKIIENTPIEGKKIITTKGFFSITYIYPRYFQNKFFFKSIVADNLRIKKIHKIKSKDFMNKISTKFTPIAVHVRSQLRNNNEVDTFKIFGQTTVLPINYFYECINWFEKNIKNPYYIILSDNPNYVKKKFSYLKNKIFSKNSIEVDLLIISNCSYGVLSNSSISWWGSYLSKKKKIFFAPKYWMGWKSKIEVQKYGTPIYCTLVDPNKY